MGTFPQVLWSPSLHLTALSFLCTNQTLASSSSSQVEAARALPALQQQQPLLSSARSPSPVQQKPRHQKLTLPQNPNLSLQLPVPRSHNLSLHQLPLRTPPRTPQLHLVLQQLPPQCPFQTGSRQLPRSPPGHREARTPGLRRWSGRRVWQSEFEEKLHIVHC